VWDGFVSLGAIITLIIVLTVGASNWYNWLLFLDFVHVFLWLAVLLAAGISRNPCWYLALNVLLAVTLLMDGAALIARSVVLSREHDSGDVFLQNVLFEIFVVIWVIDDIALIVVSTMLRDDMTRKLTRISLVAAGLADPPLLRGGPLLPATQAGVRFEQSRNSGAAAWRAGAHHRGGGGGQHGELRY